MQKVKAVVLLLMLPVAVASAACGARAQVIEDQPTLVVPPVPPRTIEPAPPAEPPAIPPVPNLSAPPVTPLKPKPAPKNETKPEPKPEAPTETTTAGASTPPPVEPLRTPTTPSGPEALKQVREALFRTDSILSKVDYQKLTADRRLNYDTVKGYMQQAEEALKKEDLTQARMFALRAESIAKQLDTR